MKFNLAATVTIATLWETVAQTSICNLSCVNSFADPYVPKESGVRADAERQFLLVCASLTLCLASSHASMRAMLLFDRSLLQK
jgi:hypothetical protein